MTSVSPLVFAEKLMYKIMVRTGKKALEESDVNVYIYLVGQKRETGKTLFYLFIYYIYFFFF